MTVSPARLPRAVAGLTLAVAVSLTGCAGTDSSAAESVGAASPAPSSAPATGSAAEATGTEADVRIEVQIAGGQVTGDTGRIPVPAGEQVALAITSDVTDTVHVHGYDLEAELAPGPPVRLTFDATVPGVFEVELHEAGTVLLTLQVG